MSTQMLANKNSISTHIDDDKIHLRCQSVRALRTRPRKSPSRNSVALSARAAVVAALRRAWPPAAAAASAPAPRTPAKAERRAAACVRSSRRCLPCNLHVSSECCWRAAA